MKFKIEFCSNQQYLPTKRHKKIRRRYEKHSLDIEIIAVDNSEFPVAFLVTGENMLPREIRTYGGKLYKAVKKPNALSICDIINVELTNVPWELEYEHETDFSEESVVIKDDVMEQEHRICKQAKEYIISDGKVWRICKEPMYCVSISPCGSVAFSVEYCGIQRYHGEYFNAFEKEQAIAYIQKRISLWTEEDYTEKIMNSCNIDVLMPEMVDVYKDISKDWFLHKCKNIMAENLARFDCGIEGASVTIVNEDGRFNIHVRMDRYGYSECFYDSYDGIEDTWNYLVKKIRAYQYLPFLEKYEVSGDLSDVLAAVHGMLEHRIEQLTNLRETDKIENLKIAIREIQNLI